MQSTSPSAPTYQKHATLSHYLKCHDRTQQDISGKVISVRGRLPSGNFVRKCIIIYACQKRAFVGPHYVQMVDDWEGLPSAFWVHSVTCIKRKFLGFNDTISFERSAYVTIDGYEYIVGDIRPYLTLQRATPTPGQDLIYHSREKQTKYRLRKRRLPFDQDKALRRSRRLMERSVQKVVSAYHRDMDDAVDPHIDDVCSLVVKDMTHCLDMLSLSYGVTWAGELLEQPDQRVEFFEPIMEGSA